MLPTTSIVYPTTLPVPQAASIQSLERRVLSPDGGFFEARAAQRDRMVQEQIAFPPLNETQAAAFSDWWQTTLLAGGLWFSATWPLPRGMVVAVRRFIGPPRWDFMGLGLWRVTADFEVRGLGSLPVEYESDCPSATYAGEIAMSEPDKVYLWHSSDPDSDTLVLNQPILGTYMSLGRDPGAIEPGSYFPCTFAVDWDDLAEPPGVSVFSGTRNGNYPNSTMTATIIVSNAPNDPRAIQCRACVFQSVGTWLGVGHVGEGLTMSVSLNDAGVIAFAKYYDTGPGADVAQACFLIRNERGSLSGVDLAFP